MTEQEIFNIAWNWFVTKKNPRSFSSMTCMYRGPNGARCVVGLFIPDEYYRADLEGRNLCDGQIAECLSKDAVPHRVFLRELQDIHDNQATGTHIARELFVEFAKKNSLEVPDNATADLFGEEVPNG